MKRILALMLTAILATVNLSACGNTENKPEDNNDNVQQTEDKGEEDMAVETRVQLLTNTYHKLTQEKKLTIAYIGGSVTDGYGSTNQSKNAWSAHLANHIREQYPDVELSNIKKSIGGTGSYFASFRYEREVAPIEPDLLFVEYAINDKYNGVTYDQVVKSAESIVRLANKFNPAIDIIFVLTFDSTTKDSDYDQLKAHRDVAQYYGYPSLKMADKVYPMLAETGDDYYVYFKDGVHPNDEGYAFYGKQVIALFDEEIAKAKEAYTDYEDHVLPEKLMSDYVTLDANMLYADEIDLTDSEGWTYQPSTNFSWLGTRYNGRIFANELGAKLTFELEGTDLGLATGIGPNMGIITVTVDDREPVVIDEYRTSPNPKDRVIAEGLEDTTHTVTIEVTGKNEKSGGYEFEIGAILIN